MKRYSLCIERLKHGNMETWKNIGINLSILQSFNFSIFDDRDSKEYFVKKI